MWLLLRANVPVMKYHFCGWTCCTLYTSSATVLETYLCKFVLSQYWLLHWYILFNYRIFLNNPLPHPSLSNEFATFLKISPGKALYILIYACPIKSSWIILIGIDGKKSLHNPYLGCFEHLFSSIVDHFRMQIYPQWYAWRDRIGNDISLSFLHSSSPHMYKYYNVE